VAKLNVLFLAALSAAPALAADLPATLQWSQRVELAAPASGVVQAVNVNVGDRVKKGQTLLTLDAAAYSAGVAEARAEVVSAEEEARDAKRNLDRVQELYNRTVIALTELEQAQVRQVRANTQVDGAKAKLAAHQKQLRDAAVRAPFDALVLVRQVEPGQAVASQFQPQTLFTLARAGEMVARGKASLAQVEKLKVGDAVTVEVNRQSYAGKIKTLGLEPVGEKGEIGYPVDVLFAVKEVLRAGTPATLKLP
jgi:multidrug efflux system membrane fusion protein